MFGFGDQVQTNPYARAFLNTADLCVEHLNITPTSDLIDHIIPDIRSYDIGEDMTVDALHEVVTQINAVLFDNNVVSPCNNLNEDVIWSYLKNINFMLSELLIQIYILKAQHYNPQSFALQVKHLYDPMYFLSIYMESFYRIGTEIPKYRHSPNCSPKTLISEVSDNLYNIKYYSKQ